MKGPALFSLVFLCSWLMELVQPVASMAYAIRVSVTREAQDLYEVNGSTDPSWVVTNFCYEWAYYDEAILDYSSMELYFIESETLCDVAKIR